MLVLLMKIAIFIVTMIILLGPPILLGAFLGYRSESYWIGSSVSVFVTTLVLVLVSSYADG